MNFYDNYIKRLIDIILSLAILILLGWLYIILGIIVSIKLGRPVLFCQPRPGKDGKIFNMYKFRSMTSETDENGNLLPDEVRLTPFGAKLRDTSLDELPELFCILKGDMSFVGPRPQLVRDMVFMTAEQNRRHQVRPGLTGLAQINGRNAISWEKKLEYDQKYIEDVSFINDLKIFFGTFAKVFKHEDITMEGMATALDLGDYLLQSNQISYEEYQAGMTEAVELLNDFKKQN